eukprot:467754-Pyramimonas_sp.AAC.1
MCNQRVAGTTWRWSRPTRCRECCRTRRRRSRSSFSPPAPASTAFPHRCDIIITLPSSKRRAGVTLSSRAPPLSDHYVPAQGKYTLAPLDTCFRFEREKYAFDTAKAEVVQLKATRTQLMGRCSTARVCSY